MSRFRCRLGWHDWNAFGKIVDAYSGLTQFKSCKICNKIAYTSCVGNQARADVVNDSIKGSDRPEEEH